jgi:hypothetical protein
VRKLLFLFILTAALTFSASALAEEGEPSKPTDEKAEVEKPKPSIKCRAFSVEGEVIEVGERRFALAHKSGKRAVVFYGVRTKFFALDEDGAREGASAADLEEGAFVEAKGRLCKSRLSGKVKRQAMLVLIEQMDGEVEEDEEIEEEKPSTKKGKGGDQGAKHCGETRQYSFHAVVL